MAELNEHDLDRSRRRGRDLDTSARCGRGSPSWRRCSRRGRRRSSAWARGSPSCRATRRRRSPTGSASSRRELEQLRAPRSSATAPSRVASTAGSAGSCVGEPVDDRRRRPATDALIAELRAALARLATQQALLRSSLATVIGVPRPWTGDRVPTRVLGQARAAGVPTTTRSRSSEVVARESTSIRRARCCCSSLSCPSWPLTHIDEAGAARRAAGGALDERRLRHGTSSRPVGLQERRRRAADRWSAPRTTWASRRRRRRPLIVGSATARPSSSCARGASSCRGDATARQSDQRRRLQPPHVLDVHGRLPPQHGRSTSDNESGAEGFIPIFPTRAARQYNST